MQTIDFRSDTVTRPSEEMKAAMSLAAVGDDVFAEDPTAEALQARCAQMFGHEAALFFPSGTMANQAAIQVHASPGDEVICGDLSHIYHYEGGGIARNAGASVRLLSGNRGRFSAEQVRGAVNPPDSHFARTALVAIEDTVNKGGGAVWDLGEVGAIRKATQALGLPLHADGARVWNAQIARGADASPTADWSDYGQLYDSLSVCFSKGMGAPVGSVLIGHKAFIQRAHRVRKVMGGGMRQIGGLAAACMYALDHHLPQLHQDHDLAKQWGDVVLDHPEFDGLDPVESNIVIATLRKGIPSDASVNQLAQLGILCMSFGPTKIRWVMHRDIEKAAFDSAAERLREWRYRQ
jgi:threonine aldolase